jgi:hypothetical protein
MNTGPSFVATWLFPAILAIIPSAHADTVILDNANQSGLVGSTLTFSGIITNTTGSSQLLGPPFRIHTPFFPRAISLAGREPLGIFGSGYRRRYPSYCSRCSIYRHSLGPCHSPRAVLLAPRYWANGLDGGDDAPAPMFHSSLFPLPSLEATRRDHPQPR